MASLAYSSFSSVSSSTTIVQVPCKMSLEVQIERSPSPPFHGTTEQPLPSPSILQTVSSSSVVSTSSNSPSRSASASPILPLPVKALKRVDSESGLPLASALVAELKVLDAARHRIPSLTPPAFEELRQSPAISFKSKRRILQRCPTVVCSDYSVSEDPAKQSRQQLLESIGCRVLRCKSDSKGRLSLSSAFEALAPYYASVMVEGGGQVIQTLLDSLASNNKLVDQILLTICPTFVGGYNAVRGHLLPNSRGHAHSHSHLQSNHSGCESKASDSVIDSHPEAIWNGTVAQATHGRGGSADGPAVNWPYPRLENVHYSQCGIDLVLRGDTSNFHCAPAASFNRPFITLTYAQSLDGSIASPNRSMLALSSSQSLNMTHALRSLHDGIAVGIGTIEADDPSLTTRLVYGKSPHPIIFDSHLRLAQYI